MTVSLLPRNIWSDSNLATGFDQRAQLGKGNKVTNYALRPFSLLRKPLLTNITLPRDTE